MDRAAIIPAETERTLTAREIAVLRHLAIHCGAGGQVLLKPWQRAHALGLWRQHLVVIWYRQLPTAAVTRGPFYGLTDRGQRLATALLAHNKNLKTGLSRPRQHRRDRGFNNGDYDERAGV